MLYSAVSELALVSPTLHSTHARSSPSYSSYKSCVSNTVASRSECAPPPFHRHRRRRVGSPWPAAQAQRLPRPRPTAAPDSTQHLVIDHRLIAADHPFTRPLSSFVYNALLRSMAAHAAERALRRILWSVTMTSSRAPPKPHSAESRVAVHRTDGTLGASGSAPGGAVRYRRRSAELPGRGMSVVSGRSYALQRHCFPCTSPRSSPTRS